MDPTLLLIVAITVASAALGLSAFAASKRRERALQAALAEVARDLEDAKVVEPVGALTGRLGGRKVWAGVRVVDGRLALRLAAEVDHGRPLMIRRAGVVDALNRVLTREEPRPDADPGFVVTGNEDAVERAYASEREPFAAALAMLFDHVAVAQLLAEDGRVWADVPDAGKLPRSVLLGAFHALVEIASALERREIAVRVLGATRLAWTRGAEKRARCPYCKDALTGEEPDLVACRSCGTVHHEGCFREHGRCTLLGCEGKDAERGEGGAPRERGR